MGITREGFVLMKCKSFPFRKVGFPLWIVDVGEKSCQGFRRYEDAIIYEKLLEIEKIIMKK